MPRSRTPLDVPFHVQVTDWTPGIANYAEQQVRSVLRYAHEPVLHGRVRLLRHGDRARARPVTAQANLDVNGRLVRAQVAAPTSTEAVDLLRDRLQHRLRKVASHWEARRKRVSTGAPHEWRHGDEPTDRPAYFPPAQEREIVRHKTFTLARCDVDEAAFDMEAMDYDFHLFTEIGTGQDSVLYRAGPTGYRLAQIEPRPQGLARHALELTVSDHHAPRLTTSEAVDRMASFDQPFLFYLDGERGRGALLYHRYDGNYGVITPSE